MKRPCDFQKINYDLLGRIPKCKEDTNLDSLVRRPVYLQSQKQLSYTFTWLFSDEDY